MSRIRGTTKLVGLIGWPVAHSLSPAMHNAAAAELALDMIYVPLPVRPEALAAAVRGLPALGFRGVNVTVPHKETVIPLLDDVDPAARAIGAVNTIVVGGRRSAVSSQQSAVSDQSAVASPHPQTAARDGLVGYNTDWSGFVADLEASGVGVSGKDCLVLGAGGAARAVVYGLASAGGRARIFARRVAQARQLVQDLAPNFKPGRLSFHRLEELAEAGEQSQPALIVNATPVGMMPDANASPWPNGLALPKDAFVYDLVYNPSETEFMRQAKAAGNPTVSGLGMLLRQGALAFKMWTGVEPDTSVMAAAL